MSLQWNSIKSYLISWSKRVPTQCVTTDSQLVNCEWIRTNWSLMYLDRDLLCGCRALCAEWWLNDAWCILVIICYVGLGCDVLNLMTLGIYYVLFLFSYAVLVYISGTVNSSLLVVKCVVQCIVVNCVVLCIVIVLFYVLLLTVLFYVLLLCCSMYCC